MTVTIDERSLGSVKLKTADFYVYMSVVAAAVAFLGFAPTYWAPLLTGTFRGHPVTHLHGAICFSWTLFVVFQTWLAASGRIAWHRSLGMAGVSLATAMTIFGFLATIKLMETAAATGHTEAGKAFAIVPFTSIMFFAVTFIFAIVNLRRPEWHKRLMLLATISILSAAIARWFVFFLAPLGPHGPPPVSVEIMPVLVTAMLLVVVIVFDWRMRGRPHPAYVAGSVAYVAVKVLGVPVSETAAWHAVAGWLMGLAA
jgi:hypothetical protein